MEKNHVDIKVGYFGQTLRRSCCGPRTRTSQPISKGQYSGWTCYFPSMYHGHVLYLFWYIPVRFLDHGLILCKIIPSPYLSTVIQLVFICVYNIRHSTSNPIFLLLSTLAFDIHFDSYRGGIIPISIASLPWVLDRKVQWFLHFLVAVREDFYDQWCVHSLRCT